MGQLAADSGIGSFSDRGFQLFLFRYRRDQSTRASDTRESLYEQRAPRPMTNTHSLRVCESACAACTSAAWIVLRPGPRQKLGRHHEILVCTLRGSRAHRIRCRGARRRAEPAGCFQWSWR